MSTALPNAVKSTLALLKRRPHWFVFPLERGSKSQPLTKDDLDTGNSNKPADVIAWAKQHPGCNFGLALKKSRAIVADVDDKPGKVGAATWAMLKAKHADELGDSGVDDTFTVRTPSGGLHFYFDETDAVRYRQKQGAFGPDVDSPPYVVIAGSKTVEGYRQSKGIYRVINKAPIQPAPDWFAEYQRPSNDPPPIESDDDQIPVVDLDTKVNVRRAVDWLEDDAPPCVLGKGGEETLLNIAAKLKDFGISETLAVEMLDRVYNNEKHCYAIVKGEHVAALWTMEDDGPDSLPKKVRNAYQYCKQNAPGFDTAAADFGDDVEEFSHE
jgi:hypothetical protein